jgi:hypothetical protein
MCVSNVFHWEARAQINCQSCLITTELTDIRRHVVCVLMLVFYWLHMCNAD